MTVCHLYNKRRSAGTSRCLIALWAAVSFAGFSTTAESASASQIELQTKGAICGARVEATGAMEIKDRTLVAALTMNDGEIVRFSTLRDDNNTFRTCFNLKSGDGFEFEGKFDGLKGRGRWNSPTLSCAGDWNTK